MSIQTELQTTIEELVQKGKGILAADESNPTIAKRFKPIATEPTEEKPPYLAQPVAQHDRSW